MRKVLLALVLITLPITAARAVVPTQDQPIVVLRALDKANARVGQITARVNEPLKFGNLTITARTCRETPPEETPESAAFLDITETTLDGKEQDVFHGWMFASSPALSAMEHPIYDLWVMGCKSSSTK